MEPHEIIFSAMQSYKPNQVAFTISIARVGQFSLVGSYESLMNICTDLLYCSPEIIKVKPM